MNFFEEFFKAIRNSIKGLSLVFEKGLWLYLFYPLVVWLLMWGVSIYLFASVAESVSEIVHWPVFLSTVTPGKFPTFWFKPVNTLNSELFPLFGLPTNAMLIFFAKIN